MTCARSIGPLQELQLMIKGLVGGFRTLCLANCLLFSVLYVIAVFATIAIGQELSPTQSFPTRMLQFSYVAVADLLHM